ncbi:hypothetical protein QJU23_07515 [Pasteurella atlantica]|uniref:Uncharacterized protein n=2 Tax=Pasteurellaceae TaxID=712 RepID=A0ACC6HN85_9PAST|nr:hypothetical protein [Pasteurella atlantica]MDP8052268.1 hypothetical protein [Pasteurella atlantica]MDP8106094.1 hypothetical protein [Pasteurella atlantica]MDP8149113.1 hypothetical protein [Pasteurella atlantica]
MEWQGVNLTNYHQTNWLNKIKKRYFYYMVLIVIFIILAVMIKIYSNNFYTNGLYYQQQNNKFNLKIKNKEALLNNFLNKKKMQKNLLNAQNIKLILDKIQNLPIEGAVNEINIKHNITDYFLILGKLNKQEDFEKISAYLKRIKNTSFSINMLQTNSDNQLEFIIKVSFI